LKLLKMHCLTIEEACLKLLFDKLDGFFVEDSRREILEELRKKVESCRRCPLWRTRKNPVFGEGPVDAEIMLIGLGPGYHEDIEGRPFVGAAGKFLDKLLKLAGLDRSEVYITNVMKCYLPENKASEDEIEACTPYLDKQIEVIQPRIIVALGNIATEYLFKKFGLKRQSMGKIHGKIYRVSSLILQAEIIPMYHPASALRNPPLRGVLMEDWRRLGEHLREKSR